MTQPLIYTTKGNILESELTYSKNWYFTENDITFIERYHLGDELVKEAVHKFLLQGHTVGSLQGMF